MALLDEFTQRLWNMYLCSINADVSYYALYLGGMLVLQGNAEPPSLPEILARVQLTADTALGMAELLLDLKQAGCDMCLYDDIF